MLQLLWVGNLSTVGKEILYSKRKQPPTCHRPSNNTSYKQCEAPLPWKILIQQSYFTRHNPPYWDMRISANYNGLTQRVLWYSWLPLENKSNWRICMPVPYLTCYPYRKCTSYAALQELKRSSLTGSVISILTFEVIQQFKRWRKHCEKAITISD